MQQRSSEKEYAEDGYTVKWTFANELGLIFVAVYQKILELTWVDELLVTVKKMFVKLYADSLKTGDTTAVIADLNGVKCHFGTWFDAKVQSYEGAKVCVSASLFKPLTFIGWWRTTDNDFGARIRGSTTGNAI